ncbi:MAG TPA: helix-turn-helix domain-containing protein, partial [bacterium]|nr:helix-turn-helix domain-containing protein [bacterium]
DIIKKTRKTKSAVSQHLRILRNLDLVKYHRENDKTVYQIKKGDVLKNIYKIENFYIRLLNK